jgi:hypothetical protein
MTELIKGIAKPLIGSVKFMCKLHWTNQLIMSAFLAFIAFLIFEYLVLDKESKMLPENFHSQEEQVAKD